MIGYRRFALALWLGLCLAGPLRAERLLAPTEVIDAFFTNTSQIETAPFPTTQVLAGVNFVYSGSNNIPSGTKGLGYGFDNINISGAVPPTGPFALTENAPGVSLALNLGFTSDNTVRLQNAAGIAGTDATVFRDVATQIFYVSNGGAHGNPQMTFSGLGADREVFVHIIGGDSGWAAALNVFANGDQLVWNTAADGNGSTPSLFGFSTQTDALGDLNLRFTITSGSFAGVGGVMISGLVTPPLAPEPTSIAIFGLAIAAVAGVEFWRRRRAG